MGRKKRPCPPSIEELAQSAHGIDLIHVIEREIEVCDELIRKGVGQAKRIQDERHERRLRLGRLLFLLKHGIQPLGATEADQKLYARIAAADRSPRDWRTQVDNRTD